MCVDWEGWWGWGGRVWCGGAAGVVLVVMVLLDIVWRWPSGGGGVVVKNVVVVFRLEASAGRRADVRMRAGAASP